MTAPLKLIEIRKTQRRVAALLQYHDVDVYVPKPGQTKKQKTGLLGNLQVCSRLDPDGKYRDPALDYLHRGIQESREYYDENILNRSTSTEVPFNTPEVTRLSLFKESSHFQKKKSHFVKSHFNETVTRHIPHQSQEHHKRQISSLFGDDNEKLTGENERNLHKRISRSQDNIHVDKEDGRSHERLINRTIKSEQSKRNTSLPPIHSKNRKSHSSESSRVTREHTKANDTSSIPKLPRILQEDSEPHLRYQHGIPRDFGENMEADDPIHSNEKSSSDLVHITNYYSKKVKKTCKCGHSVVKSENFNDKSAGNSRPHTCEVCGQLVHQPKTPSSVSSAKHITDSRKSTSHSTRAGKKHRSEVQLYGENSMDKVPEQSNGVEPMSRQNSKTASQYSSINSLDSDEIEKAKKKVSYTGLDEGGIALPNTPPSYMETLSNIDQQLESGIFDYEPQVNINDVNTKLKMKKEKVRTRSLSSGESYSFKRKTRQPSVPLIIFPDGAREAYIKALAVSQAQKMNPQLDPFWLEKQLSRSYVFSYYQNIHKFNVSCLGCGGDHPPNDVHTLPVIPKGKEMKHIFGKVDVNQYYPGMPKNPIKGITEHLFKNKPKKRSKKSATDSERSSINSGKIGSGLNVERQLSSMSNEIKQKMSKRK